MDWGLIGFYIANIGNTPARNVVFRVIIPAKPIVFAWDRIYYTLENKLDDDHSLYQCSHNEKLGTIIEGTVGNITNREGTPIF